MKVDEFIDSVSKAISVDKINALVELRDELKHYCSEDEKNIDTTLDILQKVISSQTKSVGKLLEQFKK